MPLALALDLGTTSIAAMAIDSQGRIVAKVQLPNTAAVTDLPRGYAEQDPTVLRELAWTALRRLAANLHDVPVCLGLTGQMHGGLFIDEQRRPLSNLITWQDRRAHAQTGTGPANYCDQFLKVCDPAAIEATGCRLAAGYLGVTLYTLQRQDSLPVSTHRAVFLADWIAAELCDAAEVVTDRSNAASSGVYDLQADCWSDALLTTGGIRPEIFPEVLESGAVIGHLPADVAAELGLPKGLPVCNAIGDNQAAVLGSVPTGDPAIQINVGTGGQINWPVKEFLRVDSMDTRYLPQDRFMLVGAGLAGGDAYAWVNRTMDSWLKAFGAEVSGEEIYEKLGWLAADLPPDNAGLTCEPLFRGTRRQPSARGSFQGITFENFTPGHVARAVLTGIAAGMYSFYEQAGSARPVDLPRIIGSGNGLRKNPLLVKILSETFQRPIWLPAHHEEAAFGAALLAGTSVGMWPDLERAGETIQLTPAEPVA